VVDISDDDLKQFPVENVSWHDAQAFIKELNSKERDSGYMYRLPTDAEWEYACRGAASSPEECSYHFYAGKPSNDLSSRDANFDGEHPAGNAPKGPNLKRTTKVGSYPPNKLGLYDMHGNLGQWCQDAFAEGDPGRVARGGAFLKSGIECRAGLRSRGVPGDKQHYCGFRVVRVRVGNAPSAAAPFDEKQALPTVALPLGPPRPDLPLDLASAFRSAYDLSAQPGWIRYREETVPPPALSAEDQTWVCQIVRGGA
jgi:hypothetical protein